MEPTAHSSHAYRRTRSAIDVARASCRSVARVDVADLDALLDLVEELMARREAEPMAAVRR
jgi:hypothetical protein